MFLASKAAILRVGRETQRQFICLLSCPAKALPGGVEVRAVCSFLVPSPQHFKLFPSHWKQWPHSHHTERQFLELSGERDWLLSYSENCNPVRGNRGFSTPNKPQFPEVFWRNHLYSGNVVNEINYATSWTGIISPRFGNAFGVCKYTGSIGPKPSCSPPAACPHPPKHTSLGALPTSELQCQQGRGHRNVHSVRKRMLNIRSPSPGSEPRAIESMRDPSHASG